jgi:hypothetical protein
VKEGEAEHTKIIILLLRKKKNDGRPLLYLHAKQLTTTYSLPRYFVVAALTARILLQM